MKIQIDNFNISIHNLGNFSLDGGAMFGSVPKNLWSKRIEADQENRIRLATNCLLIAVNSHKFLVDVGMGDKWQEKQKAIFAIDNFPQSTWGFNPNEITDVILTHLHFDHAGGISKFKENTQIPELCYPQATIHVQEDNYKNAQNPNLRERASYLKENVEVLKNAKLNLTKGSQEIYPGIWVHECNGHTKGQQWVEVRGKTQNLVFTTDLVPTAHHLPLPFNMGYDICTETLLKEKEEFLSSAMQKDSIVVFQHDTDTVAATITKDDKGHYCVRQKL